MMLAVERQSMWQPKLARLCSFSAHSANKAPFGGKLMNVVVGRGHPDPVLVVDRDGKGAGHVFVATEMARPHFVISPGEQKFAVRVKRLHSTDGSLRGVEIAVAVEGEKVRPAATASRRRVSAKFARRSAVLAPSAHGLAFG